MYTNIDNDRLGIYGYIKNTRTMYVLIELYYKSTPHPNEGGELERETLTALYYRVSDSSPSAMPVSLHANLSFQIAPKSFSLKKKLP